MITPPTDLRDPDVRAAVTARLGELWAGRPVIIGPWVLAGATPYVEWFRELGCPVLVVATSRGAGPVPPEGECEVVMVAPPATASMTEELRTHDRMAHAPPRRGSGGDRRVRPGAARDAGSRRRS